MPIVNGQFVPDILGTPKEAQKQVFGDYTHRDMNDYSTAAYNYLMKQQEQAFTLDMWNLTNEYNSPAAQMQRYQDAGLNPNLIYGQQNTTSQPGTPSAAQFRPSNTASKHVQNQMEMISQIMNTVKSARDTFDYLKYGKESSYWKMIGNQESALGQKLTNEWNDWLLHGDNMIYGDSTRIPNGPGATRYNNQSALIKNQSDLARENFNRVLYLVQNIMPHSERAEKALADLREKQGEIMDGKFGAIADVDFGLGETFNKWARMFMFIALAQLM